jgi:flagellar hook-basal body complex protein FliE
VSQAEGLQTQADKQVEGLLNGEGNDVHSAMIAVEKANLSFQLMMQVRNKIVDAYQEIARMPF